MSKLKVENFGPVTSGFTEDDGFMDFRKVTVFIGNQGTGKSSVAKLYSTCSWLEKALFQRRVTDKEVTSYNRFVKRYCAYQNLQSYFRPESIVEYRGKAYNLIYRDEKLIIERVAEPIDYQVPQIMYVPAERNFLSAVDEPDKLKGLPQPLLTFWEELRQAQLEAPENLPLAIDGVNFHYIMTSPKTLPVLVAKPQVVLSSTFGYQRPQAVFSRWCHCYWCYAILLSSTNPIIRVAY